MYINHKSYKMQRMARSVESLLARVARLERNAVEHTLRMTRCADEMETADKEFMKRERKYREERMKMKDNWTSDRNDVP
jgi:hypothetical protein